MVAMPDLQYQKACDFDRSYVLLPGSIKFKKIQPIVSAFVMNMARVDSQINFPTMIAAWSAHQAMGLLTAAT
jgi:hypothetical protein